MKRIAFTIWAGAGVMCASAQEIGIPGLDTNALTMTVNGQSYPVYSPVGAFFVGFVLMLSCCVFGLLIKSVRLVGHSGGDGL